MKPRRWKYPLARKHPNLLQFVKDTDFLKEKLAEAADDDQASAALCEVLCRLHDHILKQFYDELMKVSPLHDGMELELAVEGYEAVVWVEEEEGDSTSVERLN